MNKISPFAPSKYPDICEISGMKFATFAAAIKYSHRDDVFLASFCQNTVAAGVFTKSKCPSAPVDWCKKILAKPYARALLVNSGNANAFTGKKGEETVKLSAQLVGENLSCKKEEVFLASTGVIGEPLIAEKLIPAIKKCASNLKPTPLINGAKAIMTTDSYPKIAFAKIIIDGQEIKIAGIAKGAGMIAPNMATMLSFIFTDMAISKNILQQLVETYVDETFNSISVDSDCSTSDSLLVFATQKASERGVRPIININDKRLNIFSLALKKIMHNLALQIVKDGEGISKLMKISVFGAKSRKSAKKIAFSIGNSPLVKTAIAGEDANWGRVVMAIGKAGEPADRDKISIYFGEYEVARKGEISPLYCEKTLAKYMKNPEIDIKVNVGVGDKSATIYASDLTHDYISINADYRS